MEVGRFVQVLANDWQFKQSESDEWLPVARVPTNVHLDLIENDRIEDPFLGLNELQCQWVADHSWVYRVRLPVIPLLSKGLKHIIAFDGLDTFATVRLNGEIILRSDNMWHIHRVDISDLLNGGGDDTLEIDFAPAALEAIKIRAAHPHHKWICWNGEVSRLAARKAQYHWGWDWGPILNTCGPWRQVRLESYRVRISDLVVDYEVDPSLKQITGTVLVRVEGGSNSVVQVVIRSCNDEKVVLSERVELDGDGEANLPIHVPNPQLWYPHGYGPQSLYMIQATIYESGALLDTASQGVGFRRAELVRDCGAFGEGEEGISFYFRINGIDVFCGGSCWIPADNFVTRITRGRYRRWLQLMVDGNQIMTRIWGGGIWEDDAFYDTCDELGILIWHDFMFACGNYPVFPDMVKSIEREGVDQLKRLRNHPSIIIYAGNNEDYQVQEANDLTYDFEDKDSQNWLKTDFPARYIYEKLLPDIVSKHAPQAIYHPGSPWGEGKNTRDPTVGDLHQWNVWHGTQEKYQDFGSIGGRFNSEFGMEAYPHMDTIMSFVADSKEMYPQSRTLDFHNKAAGHSRRLAIYLTENLRVSADLPTYTYLTQLVQAEALTFALRDWRRQWGEGLDKGKERQCGGALIWQLNDCWPATSWSIVDYHLRPKPAYYAVRRALAPLAVAVSRRLHDWTAGHTRAEKETSYRCWVASNRTEDVRAAVELRVISLATGKDIFASLGWKNVLVRANCTTSIGEGTIHNVADDPHVLVARIYVNGELVGRHVDWPQPLKYLDLEDDRGLHVTQTHERITVSAAKPVKGLVFEERDGVWLGDGALDVVPGDEQTVEIRGMKKGDEPLGWRYYGQQ